MRGLVWSFLLVLPLLAWTPAPVALASDSWCDTDPILLIHTPAGNVVAVYVTVGAQSVVFTPDTLLGSLVLAYTAVPAQGGKATSVSIQVTVPPSPLNPSFATRDVISTELLGTGTIYARSTGVSGSPMTSTFILPSP